VKKDEHASESGLLTKEGVGNQTNKMKEETQEKGD